MRDQLNYTPKTHLIQGGGLNDNGHNICSRVEMSIGACWSAGVGHQRDVCISDGVGLACKWEEQGQWGR